MWFTKVNLSRQKAEKRTVGGYRTCNYSETSYLSVTLQSQVTLKIFLHTIVQRATLSHSDHFHFIFNIVWFVKDNRIFPKVWGKINKTASTLTLFKNKFMSLSIGKNKIRALCWLIEAFSVLKIHVPLFVL